MNHALKFDTVDGFAVGLLFFGLCLASIGLTFEPRALNELLRVLVDEWTPSFVIDGMLLLVVNRIIKRNERLRVLAQVGSLSNEFALDAVRRARSEGWLIDGSTRGKDLQRARLADSDLSGADLSSSNLRFADLRRARLTHANLRGADLTGANLGDADVRWADLRDAKLNWADLRDAAFEGALTEGIDIAFAATDEDFTRTTQLTSTIPGTLLDPQQISLIKSGFMQVEAAGSVAIEVFYNNLFKEFPNLRPMFSGSQQRQSRKFLQSLRFIVNGLEEPERSIDVLEQLGKRHAGYGVLPEHYEGAGRTLVATLGQLLPDFTSEAENAWTAAYSLISGVMIYAASERTESLVEFSQSP